MVLTFINLYDNLMQLLLHVYLINIYPLHIEIVTLIDLMY